ncbi:MAG: NlpC/P60 family protein [Gemmataceae bacterium]
MFRQLAGAGLVMALMVVVSRADRDPGAYRSPYKVAFSFSEKELVGDLEHGPRGDLREQSTVPHNEWNSAKARKTYGSWGPPARHYPAPHGLAERSAQWKRERIIAVALRYQGYAYRHHHIPDWIAPGDGPATDAKAHGGKGVDCSNFASFAYNQGLGMKPNSGIHQLAKQIEIPGPGPGHTTKATHVTLPKDYSERIQALRTGDLLFIRNKKGEISHVVLWVGTIGRAPDNVPLILDSHGDSVKDADGNTIPSGIHLRPFLENSWYNHSASHAHRLIGGR